MKDKLKKRKVTIRFHEQEFEQIQKYLSTHSIYRNISQLIVAAVYEKINKEP